MKNYWIAIVIAFIGGCIGLQEFYLGRLGRGILGLLFCWTFIPGLIAFIQICKWLYIGENEFNKQFNKQFNKSNQQPLNS